METQAPFMGPTVRSLSMARPLLDLPITKTAVERLVENILTRHTLTSDELLQTADAVREIILEAPSDADLRRLRFLLARLEVRAAVQARTTPGKAEAAALLRICPASAASLRMWRSSMPFACSQWGWLGLLDAMIAAADEMELTAGSAG